MVQVCNDGWKAQYDADAQELGITLSSFSHTALCIKKQTISSRNYVGTNAFGVKVRVRSLIEGTYAVSFNASDWLTVQGLVLAISAQQARVIKPHIRLLLVCSLREPFTQENVIGQDATVRNRYEHYIDEHYVTIQPEQLWIFDARSGRVLSKLKPSTPEL